LVRGQVEEQRFLTVLCEQTFKQADLYVKQALNIEVLLVDFDGSLLARYPQINRVD